MGGAIAANLMGADTKTELSGVIRNAIEIQQSGSFAATLKYLKYDIIIWRRMVAAGVIFRHGIFASKHFLGLCLCYDDGYIWL